MALRLLRKDWSLKLNEKTTSVSVWVVRVHLSNKQLTPLHAINNKLLYVDGSISCLCFGFKQHKQLCVSAALRRPYVTDNGATGGICVPSTHPKRAPNVGKETASNDHACLCVYRMVEHVGVWLSRLGKGLFSNRHPGRVTDNVVLPQHQRKSFQC